MDKTTLALFIGNRGIFPAPLSASARQDIRRELIALGDYLNFDVALPQERCQC